MNSHTIDSSEILCPGDICIDATAGNGHDSLFLAQLTAPNGIVYAVDIQESAILKTTDRLKQHGFKDQLKTIHESHENLDHIINLGLRGNIATIMFYLDIFRRQPSDYHPSIQHSEICGASLRSTKKKRHHHDNLLSRARRWRKRNPGGAKFMRI